MLILKLAPPNSLLDCGNIKDTGTLQSGSPFTYIYNGADTPVYALLKREDEKSRNRTSL